MKQLLLLSLFLFIFLSFAFAQKKVDRYCYINVEEKSPLVKQNVHLYFGSIDSLFSFKDSNELIKLKMVTKLTEAADVLNYMSNIGWKLVSLTSHSINDPTLFYFKKEFDSSELK